MGGRFQQPDMDLRGKVLETAAGGTILAGLCLTAAHSYLLFHGLVEMFTVAVAWSIFFLAWNTRRTLDNSYLLLVGIAFLFVGLVDLLHTLAYKGMHIFPGNDADLATQLWITGRYLQSIALLAAPLAMRSRPSPLAVFSSFGAATVLLLGLIFGGLFPRCYVEGQGLTAFKLVSEYVVCLILMVAGLLLWRVRERFHPRVLHPLLWALALSVVSELFFTLYISVYGLANMAGHLVRLVAYYLIYRALLETGLSRPMDLLYRNLKQSEGKLRASEERFRLAFDNSPLGLFHLDAEGVVVDCNPRLTEQLGVPRASLLGLSAPNDVRHHDLEEAVSRALAGERSNWEGEYSPVKGGRTVPLRVVFNPIVDEQGRVTGVLASSEDIAERRRAEQLREEVERITRHDLKGPLNGIIGLPNLLMDDPNLTDEQRQALRMVTDAGYRMLRMINVSLDIYKMETGRYRFSPDEVDLLDVARRLVGEMRHRAGARGLEMSVLLDGREPGDKDALVIPGEELLLYSMLGNLLENAIDASPRGGRVTVSLRRQDAQAVLAVHNMGAVPEAVRGRFFEKYATHGKSSGTGLGAYSARLIARTHGGDIAFTTSEAEGTTITVRLSV